MDMLQNVLGTVSPFLPWIGLGILFIIVLTAMIKVVSGNEVLVVTGVGATKKAAKTVTKRIPHRKTGEDGKDHVEYTEEQEEQITYVPKIRIAGASFVIPFLQKARRVDICVERAVKDNDTMKTSTGVEIVIDWGISYAPNADTIESLQPFVRQFLDKSPEEREEIVMSAVAGGMRAVISKMTPQQVMVGKETLDDLVQENISTQMEELGYKVQLYIQEVRDAHDSSYYYDLAAKDREGNRKQAAQITAETDQEIRQKAATAEQIAKESELDSQVAIAEKEKDTAVRKAEFKTATDIANANAEVAGKLQAAEREQEVVEKNGSVEVKRHEQANLAALAEQKVSLTRAETSKKEAIIKAEEESEKKRIEAAAEADIALKRAEGQANAVKAKADGDAEAAKTEANGRAEALKAQANAEAEKISVTGAAEAKAIEAKGMAEAKSIEAKGKAEAEAARALSDAQAANDRVNFEIKKLEIRRDMEVEIATNIATVMSKLGEKATFYDFGGSKIEGKNLLSNVLESVPQLFKKANLENEALNGEPLTDTIQQLVGAFADPLKALTGDKSDSGKAEQKETEEPDGTLTQDADPGYQDAVDLPTNDAEGVEPEDY